MITLHRRLSGNIFFAPAVLAMCSTLIAQSAPDASSIPNPVVTSRTVWSGVQAHAGDQRVLAVVLDIHDGYHINPNRAHLHDPFLIPTLLEVTDQAQGLTTKQVRYPKPQVVTVGPPGQERQIKGLEHRAILYVPVILNDHASTGSKQLTLKLTYQACDRTQCLTPITIELHATIQVVDPTVLILETPDRNLFALSDTPPKNAFEDQTVRFDLFGWSFSINASDWLGLALLWTISALGGLLLNFTPCVLPVIPLKIMGLSRAANHRAHCLTLGVSMSLGIVGFWLVLGGLIAGVRGFAATNQLFQYPLFTLAVGLMIAIMAAGMFGLFTFRLPRRVYAFDPNHDTVWGSLGMGVMTAVLSTPCTAPFMGAAIAWAAGQPPATTLSTFSAIGFGMALPYLVLSAWPVLVDRMPRTGPASELIKQVMGLLLFAAAAYFFGVGLTGWLTEAPDPPLLLYWWPVMALIATGGTWLAYRTIRITTSSSRRCVFVGLGMLILLGSVYGGFRLTDRGPIAWVAYTPDRLATAFHEGKIVVMDFTAQWCLNCKWLEKQMLHHPKVVTELEKEDVVAMKVDLTGRNEAGNQMLQSVNRLTIPLLVVFAPDGREVFKNDFYTHQQVIEAVNQARVSTDQPHDEPG